ncbi:hypothetical protein [uncultured Alistipes sp.]|uniref:hypothetical protein n=1 Tax=uncultured Alistipes sp. TaxID=538949 RepID=UPI0025AA2138|nr:hypothetical protein [uncultured Alistipes sp.]
MKKTLLFVWAALGVLASASAQDLIVRRDSARIEARVTEISPTEIRYKRASNPDGPTYVLPLGDVRSIRYANGEEEVFAPVSAPRPEEAPAKTPDEAPESIPPTAPTAPAETSVPDGPLRVGDYYNRNGVQGIVCYVEANGRHGLVISLDETMLPWSIFRKPDLRTVGTTSANDGLENMATLERYIEANNLSWDDFPAFKWCRSHGGGWYLPAIDELLAIGHGYHGGSRVRSSRQARNRFNDALRSHGGKRMDRMVYYFSSTEKNDREALTSHLDLQPPYLVEIPKSSKFLVRAVHRF